MSEVKRDDEAIARLLNDQDYADFLEWAMPLVGDEMVVGGIEWTAAIERLYEEWTKSQSNAEQT